MSILKSMAVIALTLSLGACALPPPEQPASVSRMGRFVGLVAKCGCSDLTASQVVSGYQRVADGRYSAEQLRAMAGYVDAGATEKYDNQLEICAEACSQTCMVNAVAAPLNGRLIGDGKSCLISERDLHLTEGKNDLF